MYCGDQGIYAAYLAREWKRAALPGALTGMGVKRSELRRSRPAHGGDSPRKRQPVVRLRGGREDSKADVR